MFSNFKILSGQIDKKEKNCDFFICPKDKFCFEIILYPECKELDPMPSFDCSKFFDTCSGSIFIRIYDNHNDLLYVRSLALKKFRNFQNPDGYKMIMAEYYPQKKDDEFLKAMFSKNHTRCHLSINVMKYFSCVSKFLNEYDEYEFSKIVKNELEQKFTKILSVTVNI